MLNLQECVTRTGLFRITSCLPPRWTLLKATFIVRANQCVFLHAVSKCQSPVILCIIKLFRTSKTWSKLTYTPWIASMYLYTCKPGSGDFKERVRLHRLPAWAGGEARPAVNKHSRDWVKYAWATIGKFIVDLCRFTAPSAKFLYLSKRHNSERCLFLQASLSSHTCEGIASTCMAVFQSTSQISKSRYLQRLMKGNTH